METQQPAADKANYPHTWKPEYTTAATTAIYLHVVCEYRNPSYTEFVATYIPDETQWHPPNFVR